jgi:hypothetical protein
MIERNNVIAQFLFGLYTHGVRNFFFYDTNPGGWGIFDDFLSLFFAYFYKFLQRKVVVFLKIWTIMIEN